MNEHVKAKWIKGKCASYETMPAMQAEISVETAPDKQAEKERRAMASARSGARVRNNEIWVPIEPMLANEAIA